MQTVKLRRRVQNGLNKGEASDVSKIRDCGFENQSYRSGGINLFVAAIIHWNNHPLNTTYLERVIQVLRDANDLNVRLSCSMSKPQLCPIPGSHNRGRAVFYSSATPEGIRQAKTISWSLLFLN